MSILLHISTIALRQLIDGACSKLGMEKLSDRIGDVLSDKVVDFLVERFKDNSQRLTDALASSNKRAWKAVEIALAGDTFWERCKQLAARAEDKAFARQVRAFLDAAPLPELEGKATFRQTVLDELRAAFKAGLLTGGALEPEELARRAGAFARFSAPESLLNAERQAVQAVADEVRREGYANLAWFLEQRPALGQPVHVAGVRYFFRRAVEEDPKLFQGLAFARLEAIKDGQDGAFAELSALLSQQGERLETLLIDVKVVVVATHGAVLDIQAQIRGQGQQIEQIGQAILKLLEQRDLQKRELRPADSMSYRNETERAAVKQTTARYRALPEEDRRRLPALLHAVGKLEVVAGDFEQARQDFEGVAELTQDFGAQAEAHFNAYRAALERAGETRAREDWDKALSELVKAVNLDAKRFQPFPVAKYHPQRILGAGGFGVVFLCRHREMDDLVVIKTLVREEMDRDADEAFREARVLRRLKHPAVIDTLDADYMDQERRARPYLVMDYFDGASLDEYIRLNGALAPEDLVVVARQAAGGLQAAHGKGVWHRDVKPANLLVRKEGSDWRVKIIDFGLALVKKGPRSAGSASTAGHGKTLMGASVAGTLHYAAPEQMGQLQGVEVGPYSDVYGFGKTCFYALFKTTQPRSRHFQGLPTPLTELLEACVEEAPDMRPGDFGKVLIRLEEADKELKELKVEVVEDLMTALPVSDQWYYMRGGGRFGPVGEEDLKARIASGQLSRGDLVWKKGMANWVAVERVTDLLPDQHPEPPPVPDAPGSPAERKPDWPPPAPSETARVRFHMRGLATLQDLFSFTYFFRVYVDGELKINAMHKAGFDLQWELKPGDHVVEVVLWYNGEKDRKQFDLRLDRPGEYDIRFNYVWSGDWSLNALLSGARKGNMQNSTIDVLKRPV
jgi:serine/threonine protein kinase